MVLVKLGVYRFVASNFECNAKVQISKKVGGMQGLDATGIGAAMRSE